MQKFPTSVITKFNDFEKERKKESRLKVEHFYNLKNILDSNIQSPASFTRTVGLMFCFIKEEVEEEADWRWGVNYFSFFFSFVYMHAAPSMPMTFPLTQSPS